MDYMKWRFSGTYVLYVHLHCYDSNVVTYTFSHSFTRLSAAQISITAQRSLHKFNLSIFYCLYRPHVVLPSSISPLLPSFTSTPFTTYPLPHSLSFSSGGVDREDLARPSLKLTEEEEQADKVRIKAYGDVDQVLGRRKNGKSVIISISANRQTFGNEGDLMIANSIYTIDHFPSTLFSDVFTSIFYVSGKTMEYECSWIGQGERLVDSRRKNGASKKEDNKYIPLETMIEMGLIKLVQVL